MSAPRAGGGSRCDIGVLDIVMGHSAEILRSLGRSDPEIEALAGAGVVRRYDQD